MSAYASLPGSFLPPFFSFGASSTTAEKDGSEPTTEEVDVSSAHANSARSTDTSNASASCSARSSNYINPPAFNVLSLSPDADDSKEPRSSTPSHPSDIIIAIRSARVDPVELIKSLTSRGSNIARRTANFIARTPNVDGNAAPENNLTHATAAGKDTDAKKKCDEVSIFSSPGLCYEDTDSDEEYSMYDYSDDFSNPNDDDAHDDSACEDNQANPDGDTSAIEFELSITFQGRQYNATRTFPTFVKLRNDLLRELNLNEGDSRRSKRNLGGAKSPMNMDLKDKSKHMSTSPIQGNNGRAVENFTVPELPRVSPESLGHSSYALSGVARSGFALLQATAQHYCPEMEHWMRQVIDAFPCSQSLSSFLWEPLSSTNASWETIGEECQNGKNGPAIDLSGFPKPPPHARSKSRSNKFVRNSRLKKSGSSSTLESIEEGDGYDWDDDHST